jgi:mono/diheme cytochrome c family protein
VKNSLEIRALGWALLVALLSLGGAGVVAKTIEMTAGSGPLSAMASLEKARPEIAITPELIAQGHDFFGQSCSHCHGDDARGDEGPDLHHLAISNARIAATIKKGVKGEMPTFGKKYDDVQIAALVAYLRTLE